ncbi:MAG: RsmE family RNA methyltransferase [Desulfobacteraceae bacterium]
MRRFFIPPHEMGKYESVISGDDAHHLRDVLKLQPDELVVVFDGQGREFRARILSITRRHVRVAMLERVEAETEAVLDLTIGQGYLKDKKMDVLVRQLTELGVVRWIPFLSARSIPSPDPERLKGRYKRWQKISTESLKQCRRSRAMIITPVVRFEEVLKQAESYDFKVIFWEGAKAEDAMHRRRLPKPSRPFLVIGPEGGFDAQEIALAKQNGFEVAGLGPRILKAETAALVAAALAQFVFGDI